MEIKRKNAWWDTTHKAICDIFSSENEQLIHKRIQRSIGNTHFGKMANLVFFRRIPKISQEKYSQSLPDDLVLEILSRLSAEDVLKCLTVCKKLMPVTLTPRFFDLHQRRAPPMIMLQVSVMLYSLDLSHEKPCIRKFDTIKLLHCNFALVGTCDGLLVLRNFREFKPFHLVVCNPVTGRVVMEVKVEVSFCLGFWFHPFGKEYLFLTASHHRCRVFCYNICNFRGESTRLGCYKTVPSDEVPINISCSFYYLLTYPMPPHNCIMVFNTETETMDFKPHPQSHYCYQGHCSLPEYVYKNGDMQLLEMEGSLAFAHMCTGMNSLHLWILEDRATWHWNERYKINLNLHGDIQSSLKVCPTIVHKGELLMLYKHKRLIAFNLQTRRIRTINLRYRVLKSTTYRSSFVGLHRLAHK